MVNIALYPILGKPFILYLGVLTLTSFLITAVMGIGYYRGQLKFKWHPAMVVISFFLAIFMTVVGISVRKPFVGILGILTIFFFFIAAMVGLIIHQRWANTRFIWHPTVVIIAFIFAIFHGVIGILAFI